MVRHVQHVRLVHINLQTVMQRRAAVLMPVAMVRRVQRRRVRQPVPRVHTVRVVRRHVQTVQRVPMVRQPD